MLTAHGLGYFLHIFSRTEKKVLNTKNSMESELLIINFVASLESQTRTIRVILPYLVTQGFHIMYVYNI